MDWFYTEGLCSLLYIIVNIRESSTINLTFFAWTMVFICTAGVVHAKNGMSYKALKEHSALNDKGTSTLNLSACQQKSGHSFQSTGTLHSPIARSKLSMSPADDQLVFTSFNTVVAEDYTPLTVFARYVAMPDDTIIVTMQTVSPRTFDLRTDVKTFQCRLGEGMAVEF